MELDRRIVGNDLAEALPDAYGLTSPELGELTVVLAADEPVGVVRRFGVRHDVEVLHRKLLRRWYRDERSIRAFAHYRNRLLLNPRRPRRGGTVGPSRGGRGRRAGRDRRPGN